MGTKQFLFGFLLLVLSSCKKEAQPYVVFKNTQYEIIENTTIDVEQGAHYYLIVENGYTFGKPVLAIQKNNDIEQLISDSSIVSTETHGWNGQKELFFNVMRVHLDFDANQYHVGDQLTVYSRHGNLAKSLVFEVK